MTRLTTLMRAQSGTSFYVLAFLLTWLVWVPRAADSPGFFLVASPAGYLLGGLGPGLAAWIMMRLLYGRAGDRLVFGPLLRLAARWLARRGPSRTLRCRR